MWTSSERNWRRGVSEWSPVCKGESNYGRELCLLGHSEVLNCASIASTLLWAQLPYGSEIPAIPAAIWGLQMDRYSPAVGQLLEMFGFGAESPGHP